MRSTQTLVEINNSDCSNYSKSGLVWILNGCPKDKYFDNQTVSFWQPNCFGTGLVWNKNYDWYSCYQGWSITQMNPLLRSSSLSIKWLPIKFVQNSGHEHLHVIQRNLLFRSCLNFIGLTRCFIALFNCTIWSQKIRQDCFFSDLNETK